MLGEYSGHARVNRGRSFFRIMHTDMVSEGIHGAIQYYLARGWKNITS